VLHMVRPTNGANYKQYIMPFITKSLSLSLKYLKLEYPEICIIKTKNFVLCKTVPEI